VTARSTEVNFSIHPRVFGPRQCGRIIRLGDSGQQQGGIEGLAEPGTLRDSEVTWIGRDPDSDWIHRRLEAVVERSNRRWNLDLDGFSEDLQLTTYNRVGTHYTWHHDGLDDGVEHRKLSLVIQLSDPVAYEGAELEFLEVAEDYDDSQRSDYLRRTRSQGTVIAFPSFEYHRVTPLLRGRRHSLVAWVAGPPFR